MSRRSSQRLESLREVLEEVNDWLALQGVSNLLDEHAGRLLIHDDIDSFEGDVRRLLRPLIRYA